MDQTSIFDILYEKYKVTKPIRLIEFFAGYGSQALALKYLGVQFEHWKTCEWAIKSIQAYNDMHFQDQTDYSENLSVDEIKEYLYNKGISSNYNEPMKQEQVNRLGEQQVRTIYNNIKATNNLVNIQQVKGKDLEIIDKDKYEYILTYSFPCQDLSLAGKGKGMSDSSTRSGMLWEVERILSECAELKTLPQVLLMENVPQVHSVDNVADFNKWKDRLEELGYKNYFQDLIATDYEIPQTRNRCFMVSILGEYSYSFPTPKPLQIKLKDLLEENVDEKYYLSDKMINYIYSDDNSGNYNRKAARESCDRSIEKGIACTITTTAGSRPTDNFIKTNKSLQETLETNEIPNGISMIDSYNKSIRDDDLSGTITTRVDASNNTFLAIKNATSTGYLLAEEGDGVDISTRMEYHRGTVQKGKTQTTTTMGGENNGVVVKDDTLMRQMCNDLVKNDKIKENDVVFTNHITRRINEEDYYANNNLSPTMTTKVYSDIAVAVSSEDTLKKELCNKLVEEGLVEEGDIVKHSFSSQILNGNKKCVEKNDGNMITLTTRGDCFGVTVLGNYSPSNHNASRIVDKEGSAPTVMENHGTVTAVVEDTLNDMYSESEKQLFTKDDNIKRYMDSDIVDEFKEGQMATKTYPNGYGHGPRTHDNSVALNTIDKPSVKQNLRIRKLTPKECFRLMGVRDEDYENVKKNQSDSSLYHLAGDSIVVNVLMAIFGELV